MGTGLTTKPKRDLFKTLSADKRASSAAADAPRLLDAKRIPRSRAEGGEVKFKPEVINTIVELVRVGNYIEVAASAAGGGIGRPSFAGSNGENTMNAGRIAISRTRSSALRLGLNR